MSSYAQHNASACAFRNKPMISLNGTIWKFRLSALQQFIGEKRASESTSLGEPKRGRGIGLNGVLYKTLGTSCPRSC